MLLKDTVIRPWSFNLGMAFRDVQDHPLYLSGGRSGPEEATDLPQLSLAKQRPGARARTTRASLSKSFPSKSKIQTAGEVPGAKFLSWSYLVRSTQKGREGGGWTGACSPKPAALFPVSRLLRNNVWGVRKIMGSNSTSATCLPLHLELVT